MEGAMKHNTPTSSDRVENSEQEKTRILLVTDEIGPEYALPGVKEETLCSRLQFHLVDLKSNKVHLRYTPSLLRYTVVTSAVAIDNSVYLFGGRHYIAESEIESESQKLDLLRSLHHDTVFIGASRYDLTSDQSQMNVWCPAPVPTKNLNNPVFVSLGDKIYGFGKNYLEPEVLDPTSAQSKSLDLPSELVGCKVSRNAVTDPSKSRILVHVSDGRLPSPSIYAFSPNDDSTGGSWECIAVDFQDWTNAAAVVDNVIYFYKPSFPDFVRAFDLASGAWLKIRWKSKFKKVRRMNRNRSFVAMIRLGNKILCFAALKLIPEAGYSSTKVDLFKFRVEQSGKTIIVNALESYSYVLPDTRQVREFLPL
ncbi:uncharacterized protein LOC141602363 [Silene latifolia]|uniref:uncharacterized protein LOC141602363 n=1 Tax=Silene latifolia TaxID=37657 RepID=UPI003D7876FF